LSNNPATSIAIADLNGDGKPDIIVSEGNGDSIYSSARWRTAAFASGDRSRVEPRAIRSFVAAADLNGDGILDLAMSASRGGPVVLIGKGDGTFQNPVAVLRRQLEAEGPRHRRLQP
jgi:hypothetical protein